jgi:hypothetical protein
MVAAVPGLTSRGGQFGVSVAFAVAGPGPDGSSVSVPDVAIPQFMVLVY